MVWDWLASLWPSVPAGAIVTGYFKLRDARRKQAAGSSLTVTDGVDKRLVRWAKLSLRSWTGTPIQVHRVYIIWPLGLTAHAYAGQDLGILQLYASHALPTGSRALSLTPPSTIPIDNALSVPFYVKPSARLRLSKRRYRLRVLAIGETQDAQRRRVSLLLRSSPVDWSKPPQE